MNDKERLVSCSFCNEEQSSSAIAAHLMTCGNKTDQCPNCKKYIRRAIFAYHYENNCASLDEFETEVNAATNQSEIPSTSQPNHPPPSSLRPSARNDQNTTIIKVDFPTTLQPQPTISRQSDSAFCESKRITATCVFCNQQCDIGERNIHEEKCLQNPVNIRKKQSSSTNATSSQNSERLYHSEHLDDTATIPCELCQEPIEWRHFGEHLEACIKREQERMQNQTRSTDEINKNFCIRCKHCNEESSKMFLKIHEAACRKNPRLLAVEDRFKRAFQLPPLPSWCPSPYYPYSNFE